MIPIRDSIPCQTKPYVTWAVMAVCVAVYVAMLFMPDEVGQHFAYRYGMVPIRYSNPDWAYAFGLPPDHYLSFLTSLFLHGGFLHLLMNMVFLWIFADNIEDLMGHWRFLAFYIVSGLLATVTQWYFYPTIAIPVVGASGAIAGVLGAYFVRFPYATVVIMVPILFYPLFFQVPAIAFLGFWVIVQVGDVFTAAMFDNVAVDSAWWAHLGGFAVGALLHPFFIDKPEAPRELSPPAE